MGKYRTPGVTYESADQPAAAVRRVRSDIAGFVGVAQQGPLHEAIKVESWQLFVSWFGGPFDQGYLAYAVQAFFANGGRTCYVVRVGGPEGGLLAGLKPAHLSGEGAPVGTKWGLRVLADVDQVALVAAPDVVWQPLAKPGKTPPKLRCDAPPAPAAAVVAPPQRDVRTPFAPDERNDLRGALMRHCETLGDRFALIDPDAELRPDEVLQLPGRARSSYAALYYPWLVVADPFGEPGAVLTVPPSGHVAGVCARVDLAIGVQKPPANEVLQGVQGVAYDLGPTDLGDLNEGRVNAIRALPARGVRIYGARTLARDDQPEWLYVNVRRLLIMIETAIDRQTQWAVFEPNSTRLRRALERVVRNFLDSLWRLGYLDGGSADQAYSVVCDDTTNPPEDADRGRITCQLGVLPPAPAEFVVVRIGTTEGSQSADALPEGREDV